MRRMKAAMAAAAMAVIAVTAHPAAAADSWQFTFDRTSPTGVVVEGAGSAVGTDAGETEIVAINCSAYTTSDVLATGVGCYLWGDRTGGPQYGTVETFTSGRATTFTGTVVVPRDNYRLCVHVGYVSTNGTLYRWLGYECRYATHAG